MKYIHYNKYNLKNLNYKDFSVVKIQHFVKNIINLRILAKKIAKNDTYWAFIINN